MKEETQKMLKEIYEEIAEQEPDRYWWICEESWIQAVFPWTTKPVMIGDVLDWMYKKTGWHFYGDIIPILVERSELRRPLDDQPKECILYLLSLIDQWA